jgi:hypothetical protein
MIGLEPSEVFCTTQSSRQRRDNLSIREHTARGDLLTVAREAHHAERNHHRRYQVTVGRDLLDDWTVEITYGRAGQAGRAIRYASADPGAMKDVLRDRLRRRLSAPRRIGCPYRLAAFRAAPGFDAASSLPGEIMARFFQAG